MTSAEQRKKRRIPAFKSEEAEARFWDTHDFTDYAREFKPVRVHFARNLSRGITIRLDPETLATLRSQALEKGVGLTCPPKNGPRIMRVLRRERRRTISDAWEQIFGRTDHRRAQGG